MTDPRNPTGQNSNSESFRILSLDGGGIRGVFSAAVLEVIEDRIGPISNCFDLIAGTSTGGIIAAGLAAGESASRIVEFYRNHGPRIFTRPRRRKTWKGRLFGLSANWRLRQAGIDDDWLFSPKYDSKVLKEALRTIFLDKKLGTVKNCFLVIPSVDLTKGQTVVFKTPHLPLLDRDRHFEIVDILLATSAAPTYFPAATIGKGSVYVDGGVWANNPMMVALAESVKILNHRKSEGLLPGAHSELGMIQALSIGTGAALAYLQPPKDQDGIAWWMKERLIELMFLAQSQGISFEAQYLLNERYSRIDFDIPDASWKLDCTEVIDQLIHLGHEKAKENLQRIDRFKCADAAPPRAVLGVA